MSGEGDGADEGEEIAEAYAAEEIQPGGSSGSGEEEKARKGQERADGGGPAGSGGVGRAQEWDDREKRDEDDDEPGDKGGLGGSSVGQASGLELIAGGKEETDDGTQEEGSTADVAELTVVNDGQCDEGQGHAEEIEEERGGVVEGVFDEDEGCAPDRHNGQ